MLQAEKDLEREGRAELRVNLLSRITSFKVSNPNVRSQVVNFICADMKQRFDLAIQLLYQEFVNSMAVYSKVCATHCNMMYRIQNKSLLKVIHIAISCMTCCKVLEFTFSKTMSFYVDYW